MDPELKQWAEAWRSAPWNGDEFVRRAQSAHRNDAAMQAFGVAGWVLACALTACRLLTGGLDLSTPAGRWGAAWTVLACLLGAPFLVVSHQQIARARRAFVASPAGWVDDLIRLRERESDGWTNTVTLLFLATLALGALLTGAAVYAPGAFPWGNPRSAGTPWPLAFAVVALALVAAWGVVRVRQLRRELPRLRQLRRELDE